MTEKSLFSDFIKNKQCEETCKEFDKRITNVENKIAENFFNFSKDIKDISERLEESINRNKEFQKKCEEEIRIVTERIEKSKKEIKKMKNLDTVSVILTLVLIVLLYVGL